MERIGFSLLQRSDKDTLSPSRFMRQCAFAESADCENLHAFPQKVGCLRLTGRSRTFSMSLTRPVVLRHLGKSDNNMNRGGITCLMIIFYK